MSPCSEISMLKPLSVSFRPAVLAVAAAGAILALPAQATVVLDTFGPGDLANGANWSLTTGVDGLGQSLAVAFTLPQASIITDVLTSITGAGIFNLGIVEGAGLPSGAFVFSTALVNPTANSGAAGLNWTLDAGAYWLVSRPNAESFGTWAGGSQPGNAWAFTSGGAWLSGGDIDAPAARITVTAVPEPGTWALMLGGLALCTAAARRQRG
jgi:PEP-CTERM motif